MRALIEQEKREEIECRVLCVAELIPSLELAVKRQLNELEKGERRETDVAHIGHLRGIVAKVKVTKS